MTPSNELACQQLVKLVTEYLKHTLLPPQRAAFRRHLAVYPHCGRYVEQMQQVSIVRQLVGAVGVSCIPGCG